MATVTTLSTETIVNTTTAFYQVESSVARLADGGYVVVWDSYESGHDSTYEQRYDAAGARVGIETRVSTIGNQAGFDIYPSVSGLVGGGHVVTWSEYHGNNASYDLYQQLYDATGAPVGTGTIIATTAGAAPPSVAGLGGGGYVVSWMSGNEIDGQRYNATGTAVGAETQIAVTANTNAPVVASLSTGGYVLSWLSDTGLHEQLYDASGALVGTQTQAGATGTSESITGLAGGGYAVTWDSGNLLYAQTFDARGTPAGAQYLFGRTQGSNGGSEVAALSDGGYVVTFGSDSNIYAQSFDPSGVATGSVINVNGPEDISLETRPWLHWPTTVT